MKSAVSLALIVCVMASALPVAAQEQTETPVSFEMRGPATPGMAGPLARAITREVGRLTASNGESRYGDARLVTAEGRQRHATILGLGSNLIVDGANGRPDVDRLALARFIRELGVEP